MAALVGRGAEQAELNGTWQAARGGEARVIGLAGAAGIGKTALVSKFVHDAAPRRRVWVSGAPEERTLSWGVLGQAAPALAPAPVWAAPDPEADPLYVGQSFLEDIRAAGETILVLDDAHWADRQSQAALRFAARHMTGLPVLVIVIHHDDALVDESWRRLFSSAHGSRHHAGRPGRGGRSRARRRGAGDRRTAVRLQPRAGAPGRLHADRAGPPPGAAPAGGRRAR